jgi:hypothetical protein
MVILLVTGGNYRTIVEDVLFVNVAGWDHHPACAICAAPLLTHFLIAAKSGDLNGH